MIKLDVVPIGKIQLRDKGRARKEYTNIDKLVESIKDHGVIQPLAVMCDPDKDGSYILLAGGRRIHACLRAKVKDVPIRVYPKDISFLQRKSIELEENLIREPLTYSEETKLLKEIHDLQIAIRKERKDDTKSHSVRDTAHLVNKSVGNVSETLMLAKAIEAVPELGKLKNKSEALRILKKADKNYKVEEAAKNAMSRMKDTPLDKQHKKLIDSYILEDFFKGVKSVPDNSIGFIDLDPDWGIDFKQSKQGLNSTSALDYKDIPKEDFIKQMEEVGKECWRVIKDEGWLTLWCGKEYIQELRDQFESIGFYVEPLPAIWVKGKGQNRNPSFRLSQGYETFLYMRKGAATLKQEGRSNVFEFRKQLGGNRFHPTEKPVELFEEILKTFCLAEERVLAPFLGSGNVILASSNIGMDCLGFDLSKTYKDNFIVKVKEGKPGSYKSMNV